MNQTQKQKVLPRLNFIPSAFFTALFLFSAVLVLIITPLFQKGSFIDAMLYKTVAFNYAIGEASFWSMKYTNTSMTFFCEQPPLYIFLLGKFYTLFGTHFLVDRVFTFLHLCLFLIFLYRICKKVVTPVWPFFLLNLFFLLSIQAICWSFANQVIETLVLLFTAASIDFFLDFLKSKKWVFMLLFAMVLLFMFLTKGFQSCFIIVLPLTYGVLQIKKEKTLWFAFFISFFLMVSIILLAYVYEPSKNWYSCYFNARLVLTMNNVGATTNSHLHILIRLFMETIVIGLSVISLSVFLILKRQTTLQSLLQGFIKSKLNTSFFLAFLAGSLPFTLSLVQRGFYLVPSYLCLVLSVSYGFRKQWLYLFDGMQLQFSKRLARILVLLVFLASIFYCILKVNTYKREEDLAHDLELITPLLKPESTVAIPSTVWNYFNLHSYLYMQKKISLKGDPNLEGFVIVYKNTIPAAEHALLHKINLPTRELDLYYKRKWHQTER
ncbi:MAG: glycosyltransferase family 39 protein [Bacteroidia bacterium]|jgi:hypothetical protein|nr:glycosyltransferase family 39 protein [Bacteroidia bacterium]